VWICYYLNSGESPSIVNPVATVSEVDLGAASPHWHCTQITGEQGTGIISGALKVLRYLKNVPPLP
jgi:hypothetical protein